MDFLSKISKWTKQTFRSVVTSFRIVFIAFLSCIVVYLTAYFLSYKSVEITITDKEVVTNQVQGTVKSNYRIYSTQEVFENKDNFVFWKFDSSDVQRKLMVGQSFKVKVVGWRVPFFSMYRNIITVENQNGNTN